eukprot:2419204-Prymnesium_polylepis.1
MGLLCPKYSMPRHDGAPGTKRGENQSGARVDPASRPRLLLGVGCDGSAGHAWLRTGGAAGAARRPA